MAGEQYLTRDHDRIREWVEERDGWPATVASTADDDDPGLIRLDFPFGDGEANLVKIPWERWFEAFDENDLVLLHQETLQDGTKSNFNKLVSRETAEDSKAEWV
jgi:hypothetical protein